MWESSPENCDKHFRDSVWRSVDEAVDLKDCDVYTYQSDLESDPFVEQGSIWSFNYFFYNRKQKRILYFSCRAISKAVAGDVRRWGGPIPAASLSCSVFRLAARAPEPPSAGGAGGTLYADLVHVRSPRPRPAAGRHHLERLCWIRVRWRCAGAGRGALLLRGRHGQAGGRGQPGWHDTGAAESRLPREGSRAFGSQPIDHLGCLAALLVSAGRLVSGPV